MTNEEIELLAKKYKDALFAELQAGLNLSLAHQATECEVNRVLAEAYKNGVVDGKDAGLRKIQEANVLEASNGVYWLGKLEQAASLEASSAETFRKALDVEVSLTKAFLYSQAGNR